LGIRAFTQALVQAALFLSVTFRSVVPHAPRAHVDNLTLRETGEVLGVSESRVCQIHSKLRRGLRERLAEDELLFLEVA